MNTLPTVTMNEDAREDGCDAQKGIHMLLTDLTGPQPFGGFGMVEGGTYLPDGTYALLRVVGDEPPTAEEVGVCRVHLSLRVVVPQKYLAVVVRPVCNLSWQVWAANGFLADDSCEFESVTVVRGVTP